MLTQNKCMGWKLKKKGWRWLAKRNTTCSIGENGYNFKERREDDHGEIGKNNV